MKSNTIYCLHPLLSHPSLPTLFTFYWPPYPPATQTTLGPLHSVLSAWNTFPKSTWLTPSPAQVTIRSLLRPPFIHNSNQLAIPLQFLRNSPYQLLPIWYLFICLSRIEAPKNKDCSLYFYASSTWQY